MPWLRGFARSWANGSVISASCSHTRHRIALARLTAAWPMLMIGLYVSAAMLGFYTCVGFIVPRLAYPAIPPLIVAAGATAIAIAQRLPARPRAILAAGCAAIALAQIIFEVVKPGPWS